MDYEINVSLNGRHFFATHERSVKYPDQDKIFEVFKEKFPASEGYEVQLYRKNNSSTLIATTGKER